MSEMFASYIPQAWYDEAGMRRSASLVRKTSSTAIKRMRRWKHSARELSVAIAVSASLAASSVSLAEAATDTNILNVPLPAGMVHVAPAPREGASVGEVNKSFDELFAAFRSGTKLIRSDRTRSLATTAATHRNKRPVGWARKLASDVGDAND